LGAEARPAEIAVLLRKIYAALEVNDLDSVRQDTEVLGKQPLISQSSSGLPPYSNARPRSVDEAHCQSGRARLWAESGLSESELRT
jgi:hypothetical protein